MYSLAVNVKAAIEIFGPLTKGQIIEKLAEYDILPSDLEVNVTIRFLLTSKSISQDINENKVSYFINSNKMRDAA